MRTYNDNNGNNLSIYQHNVRSFIGVKGNNLNI